MLIAEGLENIVFFSCNKHCCIVFDLHNVLQVLDALELSRLTMKTVKQNLWWAFAYNIVSPLWNRNSQCSISFFKFSPALEAEIE